MLGYRVPAPNEALLISGGKSADGLPFRIVVGHGAFVVPVVRKASFLTLAMREAVVDEECVTKQGITLAVQAVIAFKVGSDQPSIAAAAQRFLDDQDQMDELTGQIFSGHLRSIVGSISVEEIIRERQILAEQVLDASKREMANLGLIVDSLQIKSISDRGSGYIEALSAPQRAAVVQAAKIAQAAASQAAAEAEQVSARAQAQYARETAVAQAQYKAEVDRAQQESAQAGPLAAAQAQQAVLAEQAKVAARNAELREAQLVAEVVRPAEAEAQRVRIQAEASAQATRLSAEAAAAQGRIALEQAVIAQLPDLVRAAADGLRGSNLTILNGADGVNDAVASLAGQGAVILRTVLGGLAEVSGTPALTGRATGSADATDPSGTPGTDVALDDDVSRNGSRRG